MLSSAEKRIKLSQVDLQVSDFVYIPVPANFASSVHRLLADLAERDTEAGPTAEAVLYLDAGLVERMYLDSHEGHKLLMQYLAAHPDEWVYTSEIAVALSHEKGSRGVAGMLGAFGKRANHRYGGLKPWETKWDGHREQAQHRMDAAHAKTIKMISMPSADDRLLPDDV